MEENIQPTHTADASGFVMSFARYQQELDEQD